MALIRDQDRAKERSKNFIAKPRMKWTSVVDMVEKTYGGLSGFSGLDIKNHRHYSFTGLNLKTMKQEV